MPKPNTAKRTGRGGARPNSGGKREGAGRKAIPASQKRVPFPSRVLPETLAAIKADAREGESVGEVVDRWAKARSGKT
jgi:hypothetical protein